MGAIAEKICKEGCIAHQLDEKCDKLPVCESVKKLEAEIIAEFEKMIPKEKVAIKGKCDFNGYYYDTSFNACISELRENLEKLRGKND